MENKNYGKNIKMQKSKLIVGLVCASLALLSGCADDKDTKSTLNKLKVFDDKVQTAFPGEQFTHDLIIEAIGTNHGGLFGGTKEIQFEGETLILRAAPGSDLRAEPETIVTDAGGVASAKIFAGQKTGDQYLDVIPQSDTNKAIKVRFVTGVKIDGVEQEISANSESTKPISVTVVGEDGSPVVDGDVYFNVINYPNDGKNAKLSKTTAKTNADGVAETSITIGSGTGKYEVSVEVDSESTKTRSITVNQLGINVFALCMNVFGGLALFVLGMKLMSDGLTSVAGEKMRTLLHLFSKNKFVGVIAGALVTAVLQSSSATTVMVIGFINAGLLNLTQSLGIVFGANIGTTITAQIIAFDISSIVMPSIIIGMVMTFFSKKVLRGWGDTILGFGLLFFGMGLMSVELKGVAQFPSFMEVFRVFDCAPNSAGIMPIGSVLGALGIGIVVTFINQSSSAATGIVLALGASGLINFYTAVILVLGSNIGTTVTAQLAAIPANRIAKQAALSHTMFNCIGVLIVLLSFFIVWGDEGNKAPAFFHLINNLTSGDALGEIPQNLPRHIANAHTVFNVATTLLLLPFVGLLARLCTKIIRVKDNEEVKYQYLEPHLLDNPIIALEQATVAYSSMLHESWDMIESSTMEHFVNNNFDDEVTASFDAREREVDKHQFEITNYLTQITRRPLTQKQAEYIPVLMHCTNDAERIADYTSNIISLASRLKEAEASISEAGIDDLKTLFACLKNQANLLMTSISEHNVDAAYEARAMEKEFTRLSNELEDKHIQRLREGTCRVIVGVIFIELLGELEKVSSKLATIAKRAPKIQSYFDSTY